MHYKGVIAKLTIPTVDVLDCFWVHIKIIT